MNEPIFNYLALALGFFIFSSAACRKHNLQFRDLVGEETRRMKVVFIDGEWPPDFWERLSFLIDAKESVTRIELIERVELLKKAMADSEFLAALKIGSSSVDSWEMPYRYGKECVENGSCHLKIWSCGPNQLDEFGLGDDLLLRIKLKK